MEADRRLPDPQPDPPCARVPHEGRARDLRRALHSPADRRDEGRRHPGRRADALLRGPDGQLLPPGARNARGEPRQDALRRAAGGRAPLNHPPQLWLHAFHRRPRPRGRRRLLRHLRRAADLRRHRHRRARHPAAVLRAHVLVQRVRGHGLGEDLPAPAGVASVPLRDEGAGDARQRREAAAGVLEGRGCPDPDRCLQGGRQLMADEKGFCLWFTGLSGSGKSTITTHLVKEMRKRGSKLEVLDGDVVRENLSKGLGFSKEDRDTNIRRIAFVANLLSRNEVPVITAAISPYQDIRDEARQMMGDRFIEAYVKASVETCEERDVKGLYAKARSGEIKEFTGVSDPYEVPENPELVIDTESQSPEESAQQILTYLEEREFIPAAVAA